MSNENENNLILIEEPEAEVKAELPPKKKRTMSTKQLENLALGRLKRVANAKQISIEKDATKRTPPIQKPKPIPAEVVEEPPVPKPKPRKQKVVYVDTESEEEPEPEIVYKKRPKTSSNQPLPE
jgi:hypothetical protein